MKITLIALPWVFSESNFKNHEGFSQNLGIGYISAFLEKHGHDAVVIDAFAEGVDHRRKIIKGSREYYIYGLSPEDTVRLIPADTDFIGISCPFNSLSFLTEVFASEIKDRYPEKPIVLGGIYPTSFSLEALTSHVDIVVRGEGELPLLNLLSGTDLTEIRGILYKQGNKIIDNGLAPVIEDLDTLPFPARHLLPMEKYFKRSPRGNRNQRTISVITSRGCPYSCNFCSLHTSGNEYGRKYRTRSPENVMTEIDALKERYGDIYIEFEDDNLTVNKKRAKNLFLELAKRKINWAINSGVMINHLDEELLSFMKISGCKQLNLALESGNERVLTAMNKQVSLDKAREVVRMCRKYKICTVAFLMIGYPGETEKSFNETIRFLRELNSLGLREIAPFIVNPHKGTPLYEYCNGKGYLKNIEDAFFNSDIVCIETEDFNESAVRQWMEMAIKIFHPYRWHIKNVLKKILSEKIYRLLLTFNQKYRNSTAFNS
ncbi:MAG: B12-binding domain-containing radical SAM protein [Nitrospirae bacterium]|nr:B12-binding domain-containing radical SAM protein [Nitrospirota bacterium]